MISTIVNSPNFVPPSSSGAAADGFEQSQAKTSVQTAHAAAFRELDGPIADCSFMAKIAAQMMMGADRGENPELVFAVLHVSDMLSDLKSQYDQVYASSRSQS
ncbi:hypothetical protein [Bradyrhizobium sp. USDA 3458]|uniref:hypothetical protein n=1 Tax=Bradyrhizobium sp. USDA 3458 TaxID=2591461 RepID=UPI0011430BD4|nr:hypothetical protein [Bradyrhizobium sp. USDA 3458]